MAKTGKRVLGEDGVWRDGQASPELLPEHMRRLPGDLVTKHEAEADKVHALDEPHIVGALEYERRKAERAEERDDHGARMAQLRSDLARIPIGESAPLNQERVDVLKFHVIRATLEAYDKALAAGNAIDPSQVYHLWFPHDNVNNYSLRLGSPPADIDRPARMRRLDLVVDPFSLPPRIRDYFARAGIDLGDYREPARVIDGD